MVINAWAHEFHGSNIEKWQKKLRWLREKLRGWDINERAWYRKLKKEILDELEMIDKQSNFFGSFYCGKARTKRLKRAT